MTATLDRTTSDLEQESELFGDPLDLPADGQGLASPAPPLRAGMTSMAAALSCLGLGWMVTRVFHGVVGPPVVAALGIAIGVGTVYLSHRLGKGGLSQLVGLGVAPLVGALIATTGDGAQKDIGGAVIDALRGGGLLQPPIPFDGGWRFLTVVLFACLGACASGAAISTGKPKLAVAIPFPIVVAAALVQPDGKEIAASAGATVFMVGALAVAYGAELASEGGLGGGFELRRLLRGAGLLVFAVASLVGIAQSDLLFPETSKDRVIPPQRPPTPPPLPDEPLFTVRSERAGPWRLGVLDVFQESAFMLPSIDPGRMQKLPTDGTVVQAARPTYDSTFSVLAIKGQTVPSPANPVQISGIDRAMQYDPRTQVFRFVDISVPAGLKYTVTAPEPPGGKELASAPAPEARITEEFTAMPPPPPGVQDLLTKAPTTSPFDRLQFVRQTLLENVVAAGGGRPVEMPPERIDQMLGGGEASPFEINAAEVMLSRWAGVPARLGFGYYGGDKVGDSYSFRPKHGAAWLEGYFEGYGWVPIMGTPPKAKSSLSNEPRNNDPKVVPTDELAVTVYVPVELKSFQLLYQLVRYYVLSFGPMFFALLVLVITYPAALKVFRRWRRRRWATDTGPKARVVVAYAELRDLVNDLNGGDPTASPVELLDDVADDDEHAELAWLVTRVLWGDLARDLRIEDLEAAEEMAASVTRRIRREQTMLNRFLAASSRASLRDPWTDEIPNAWRARSDRSHHVRRRTPQSIVSALRRATRRAATSGVALVLVLLLIGCSPGTPGASAPVRFFDALMPPSAAGHALVPHPELEGEYAKPGPAALVSEGKVFLVQDDDTIQGSVQVALFKPRIDAQDPSVQRGVVGGLGSASGFRPVRFGTATVHVLQTAEQRLYLWFPPERNVMELFVMRNSFDDAEKVVREVISHQRGLAEGSGVSS